MNVFFLPQFTSINSNSFIGRPRFQNTRKKGPKKHPADRYFPSFPHQAFSASFIAFLTCRHLQPIGRTTKKQAKNLFNHKQGKFFPFSHTPEQLLSNGRWSRPLAAPQTGPVASVRNPK